MFRPALPLAAALALFAAGCEQRPDDVAVVVSAIGGEAKLADPARGELDFASRVMLDSTAQGLVRFDGSGGIEPGLAERWIVIDGGRSYIFRLREAEWPDGTPVDAADVVQSLKRTIDPKSRVAIAPFVAVIDEIVEMTPRIVEVRLKRPRPDLLKLFAQPELAILRRPALAGTGPFRTERGQAPLLLRPGFDPSRVGGETVEPDPADDVHLRGERAARAIVRFVERESDLVLGGTYRDWPLLARIEIAPANIKVDPAAGLFGFAIVSREGFLATPENRAAIAMAFDRAALTAAFRPEWQPVETLLPARLDSAADPAVPEWAVLPLESRRLTARNRVAAWHAANPDAPRTIRVALARSPGATLLWSRIARDLMDMGLRPVWVQEDEDADLRLIDAVAPYDSGRWYLVTACRLCPEPLMEQIEAARDAPTLTDRAQRIADADMALTADAAYIPIAQPLRWSLVALRLRAWQPNARAWHPLTHLREAGQ
ncbi:ABC transporter substrate-binding protein [Sphingomonas sp. BT-65]|uniref:ABC transporter substrate-binding protein n=1 Tax=Sphingomonas sp. BT-65 TaxID=2989821 RepID=UPI0022369F3F|nr:ABC transporter substrate-binding protein [Sphingomonas sp. BT-65]MCW4460409.1 ABC transporter substrate-binding protein [Sphingomonas sp. BT-65]